MRLKCSRLWHCKICLWHKDYLVVIILRNSRGATSSENRQVTLLLDKFTFIKKISISKGVSLFAPGRREWLSGAALDLNLHSKPYLSLPCSSWSPSHNQPPHSFLSFSKLKRVLKLVAHLKGCSEEETPHYWWTGSSGSPLHSAGTAWQRESPQCFPCVLQ